MSIKCSLHNLFTTYQKKLLKKNLKEYHINPERHWPKSELVLNCSQKMIGFSPNHYVALTSRMLILLNQSNNLEATPHRFDSKLSPN